MNDPKKEIKWVSLNEYNAKVNELGSDIQHVSVLGEKNLDSGITKKDLDIIYISKDIPLDPDKKP